MPSYSKYPYGDPTDPLLYNNRKNVSSVYSRPSFSSSPPQSAGPRPMGPYGQRPTISNDPRQPYPQPQPQPQPFNLDAWNAQFNIPRSGQITPRGPYQPPGNDYIHANPANPFGQPVQGYGRMYNGPTWANYRQPYQGPYGGY